MKYHQTKKIAAALGLLLMTACASIDPQIQSVAYEYLTAMSNYNIDAAAPYADTETQQTTIVMARNLLPMVDTNYIKSDTPATITIESVSMDNDSTATVIYHKVTPIKDFHDTVQVVRYHDQWLVHTPTPVVNATIPNTPAVPQKRR